MLLLATIVKTRDMPTRANNLLHFKNINNQLETLRVQSNKGRLIIRLCLYLVTNHFICRLLIIFSLFFSVPTVRNSKYTI